MPRPQKFVRLATLGQNFKGSSGRAKNHKFNAEARSSYHEGFIMTFVHSLAREVIDLKGDVPG